MARRKKKRRLAARLLEGLLSLIDSLCEGIAGLCVGLMKGVAGVLMLALTGAGRLLLALLRAAAALPIRAIRRLTRSRRRAEQCLRLSGPEFETYVALVLADNGFRHVRITKGSGDQGVDILCERNGKTYAVQCKNYEGAVGNFAVQEAYAGAQHYGCEIPVVICPGTFTRGAKELAQSTGVRLWGERRLSHMMRISGKRPHHRG